MLDVRWYVVHTWVCPFVHAFQSVSEVLDLLNPIEVFPAYGHRCACIEGVFTVRKDMYGRMWYITFTLLYEPFQGLVNSCQFSFINGGLSKAFRNFVDDLLTSPRVKNYPYSIPVFFGLGRV